VDLLSKLRVELLDFGGDRSDVHPGTTLENRRAIRPARPPQIPSELGNLGNLTPPKQHFTVEASDPRDTGQVR